MLFSVSKRVFLNVSARNIGALKFIQGQSRIEHHCVNQKGITMLRLKVVENKPIYLVDHTLRRDMKAN